MRNRHKTFGILSISIMLIISSCKKDGCTDSSAMNYSSDAKSNDGSCMYAYEIAQGMWYFNFNCGTDIEPSDIGIPLPNSVDVQGAGNNQLVFTLSLGEETMDLNATIDKYGKVDVPMQNITISLFPIPIPVFGSGKIESSSSGDISLTYVIPIVESLTCTSDLRRTPLDEEWEE